MAPRQQGKGRPAISRPEDIMLAAQLAAALELSSWPKPGNVHRMADLGEKTYERFLAGSLAIGPACLKAATRGQAVGMGMMRLGDVGLGSLIEEAVRDDGGWQACGPTHMGYVLLGIFALNLQGLEGGILQMLNHGFSTGALFLIVGMLYERRHTRMIEEFGGLSKVMPVYATFFLIVTLSSIGLPGLNGFVGEFLILLGTFKSNMSYAVFAALGVIFAAVYMLWMFQRVMFGEVTKEENKNLKDLSLREVAVLLPLIFFIFQIGVYPKPFLSRMDASVKHLISQVESKMVKEKSSEDNRVVYGIDSDHVIEHGENDGADNFSSN